MPTIKPFRDYDEHDVLNFFRYSGSIPVNKGTFVKIIGSGFRADNQDTQFLGDIGFDYQNVVSERYGVTPMVTAANSGDAVIGMLLYDVRETDENGEKLIFHPNRAKENDQVWSGQVVPVVTRGVFLYSGILDQPVAGGTAYLSGANGISTNSNGTTVVGKFLGAKDANGFALIRIDL